MNAGNDGGNRFLVGGFRDEDLERALKLSLNPEEQMSKEQKEFVLACSLSQLEANPNASSQLETDNTRGKSEFTKSESTKSDHIRQDASANEERVTRRTA